MKNYKTILIVDANPAIREDLNIILTEKGYRVVTAGNGMEALEMLARCERPSIIFMDVIMPIMDGHQLLGILRGDAELSTIPVVIMSATAAILDFQGESGFLEKPLIFDDLLELIYSRSIYA